jgi:hypothetical protein
MSTLFGAAATGVATAETRTSTGAPRTIELYHSTHSTCSQKLRICLAEKGLA